jgi:radical SAM/Cys-rich protein
MENRIQPTLAGRGSPLASAEEQLRLLGALPWRRSFDEALSSAGHSPLATRGVEVLQINLGKRCNQLCRHCHVDAGPDRVEVMPDAVVDACLALLEREEIPTLDITGGAPELHPRFREIVRRGRALGRRVMDRCNLTVTRLPAWGDLPELFAREGVEVVASLPWFGSRETDAQRGNGVFEESIAALRCLNELGYGHPGSGLLLELVTNPPGAFLPGSQAALERQWKRELERRHGIVFNRLYALANMPIGRFLEFLETSGNLEAYAAKIEGAFNPAAVAGLMCRFTLSVGWDGSLHDCDFNQQLGLRLPKTIFEIGRPDFSGRPIRTAAHCFGCTAGAGSSCGGATVGGSARGVGVPEGGRGGGPCGAA